jgi:hypothetical membrane protein
MGSSGAADPWAWLLAGGLLLGAGAGLLVISFVARLRRDRRRATRRSTLGFLGLALGLLALCGLAVFPEKSNWLNIYFLYSGLSIFTLGLLAGLFPRALAGPLALVALGGAIFVASALDGWLRVDGSREVAVLTPFAVDGSGFRGELSAGERDSLPLVQSLSLPVTSAGLVIERLDLGGPLALVGGISFYRVSGIAAGIGEGPATDLALAFPLRNDLLDRILPLGPDMEARTRLPFVERRRESSRLSSLAALEPLRFGLVADASRGPGYFLEGPVPARDQLGSKAAPGP